MKFKRILKRFLSWIGAAAMLLSVVGCAKAPDANVIAKTNTEQIAEVAIVGIDAAQTAVAAPPTMPEASNQTSPLYEKLGVPAHYDVTLSPNLDKMEITVDANVTLPKADKLPTVRIQARDFTQDEVTRLFHALCGDTVMYDNRSQSTRAELEERMADIRERMKTAGSDELKSLEETLALYEAEYKTAPDVPTDRVCDGTLSENRLGVQSYLGKYMGVDALEYPDNYRGGKVFDARNNTYDIHKVSGYDFTVGASIMYQKQPARCRLIGYHPMEWISDKDTIPQSAVGELSITPAEAISKIEQFWADNGFSDMIVTDVFLANNHETKNQQLTADDTYGDKHIYAVSCGRVVNGVAPRIVTSLYDGIAWNYESCYFIVGDDGIESFYWNSPYEYVEVVTNDTALLPFAQIDEIFRKMILVKYEGQIQPNGDMERASYHIDRVVLEMQRVMEQGSDNKGLLIPVWNFYGTYSYSFSNGLSYGSEILQEVPDALLSINAIDGNIINIGKGY